MRVTTNAITPDFIANSHGISNSERKSAQRKISFARVLSQVVGVVLSLDEFTEEEIRNCWWSYRDKQRSKVQSRGSISAIRRNGHAFVDTIQNSYKMAHQLSMHITADGTLLKNDDLHSSDLQSWTLNGCGRGLEAWISPLHQGRREDDAREARAIVFFAQQKGVSAEKISDIYAESSRPSVVYARMMGEADSKCVRGPRNDDGKAMAADQTENASPS
jgi:hypothetical protein